MIRHPLDERGYRSLDNRSKVHAIRWWSAGQYTLISWPHFAALPGGQRSIKIRGVFHFKRIPSNQSGKQGNFLRRQTVACVFATIPKRTPLRPIDLSPACLLGWISFFYLPTILCADPRSFPVFTRRITYSYGVARPGIVQTEKRPKQYSQKFSVSRLSSTDVNSLHSMRTPGTECFRNIFYMYKLLEMSRIIKY